MGTNHSEAAFFIFQNSIGTYQLIDRKQTKYQDILLQSYSLLLHPKSIMASFEQCRHKVY